MIDIVEQLWRVGQGRLAQQAHDFARPVSLTDYVLTIAPGDRIDESLCRQLGEALGQAKGRPFRVVTGEGDALPSLLEREQQIEAERKAAILETPVVKATFEHFPDAKLLSDMPQDNRKAAS